MGYEKRNEGVNTPLTKNKHYLSTVPSFPSNSTSQNKRINFKSYSPQMVNLKILQSIRLQKMNLIEFKINRLIT